MWLGFCVVEVVPSPKSRVTIEPSSNTVTFEMRFPVVPSNVNVLVAMGTSAAFGYSLYLMDYGAPIGFRLAARHPQQVQSLIIQNGNAYDEGLDNDFWQPIKEYWKHRTNEQGDQLRSLLTAVQVQLAKVWMQSRG